MIYAALALNPVIWCLCYKYGYNRGFSSCHEKYKHSTLKMLQSLGLLSKVTINQMRKLNMQMPEVDLQRHIDAAGRVH